MEFLRSLGNAGAVANARAMMAVRRDEDRAVQDLSGRVSTPGTRRPLTVGRDRVA